MRTFASPILLISISLMHAVDGAYPLEHDISWMTGVTPQKSWFVFMETRIWKCLPRTRSSCGPRNDVLCFLGCFRVVLEPIDKCYHIVMDPNLQTITLFTTRNRFRFTTNADHLNCLWTRHRNINIHVHPMFALNLTLFTFHLQSVAHVSREECFMVELKFYVSFNDYSLKYCGSRHPWTLYTRSNAAQVGLSDQVLPYFEVNIAANVGIVDRDFFLNDYGLHSDNLVTWGGFRTQTYHIQVDMRNRIRIAFASALHWQTDIMIYNGPWPGTPKQIFNDFLGQKTIYVSSTFQVLIFLVFENDKSDIDMIYNLHNMNGIQNLYVRPEMNLENNTGCGNNTVKSWMCTFNIVTPASTYARLKIRDLVIHGPSVGTLAAAGVAIYNVKNDTVDLVAHLSDSMDGSLIYTASGNQLMVTVYAYSPFTLLSGTFSAEISRCVGQFLEHGMQRCVYLLSHFYDKPRRLRISCQDGSFTSISVSCECFVFHVIIPPGGMRHVPTMFPVILRFDYDGKIMLDYSVINRMLPNSSTGLTKMCYEFDLYGDYEFTHKNRNKGSFKAVGDIEYLTLDRTRSTQYACFYESTAIIRLYRISCIQPCKGVNIGTASSLDLSPMCDICRYYWFDSFRNRNHYVTVPNKTVTLEHIFGDAQIVLRISSQIRTHEGGCVIYYPLSGLTHLFYHKRFFWVKLAKGVVWRTRKSDMALYRYRNDRLEQGVSFNSPFLIRRGSYEYIVDSKPHKFAIHLSCARHAGFLLTIHDHTELRFVFEKIMKPLKIEHIFIDINNYAKSLMERQFSFTMWNKLLHTEIKTFRSRSFSLLVNSLLQPMTKEECALMIILLGRVPSWYSLPCASFRSHRGIVICKRRLETKGLLPHHVMIRNNYSICYPNELFVIDKCHTVQWGVRNITLNETTVTPTVLKYFINLFSIITWHSLLNFEMLVNTAYFDGNTTDLCVEIEISPGLPFDITRRAIANKSSCVLSKYNRIISLATKNRSSQVRCQGNQVKCDDDTCISQNNLCTWDDHCSSTTCSCYMDGTYINDLHFCLTKCMPGKCMCAKHYFQCSSGGCIQMSYVCDATIHCKDSSDEICDMKKMASGESKIRKSILIKDTFFCLGYLCLSGECIHLRYVNDLTPDCVGGEAEDEPQFLELRHNHNHFTCKDPTRIPCVPGLPVCYSIAQFCLFDSDEEGNTLWCRDGAHLGDCFAINCTNSYKCPESYCIPFHRVCDGYADCIHGEDEERCPEYLCKGLLRCIGTKICVHPVHVCDGVRNCPSGDDETFCDLQLCPNKCNCLSQSVICIPMIPYTIPIMPGNTIKHLEIVFSHMHHPNFRNICDQRELLFLNLSRNHIQDICETLRYRCNFFENLLILDISDNEINFLQSSCFLQLRALRLLSLEYNPLYKLEENALSHPLISYVIIRHTHMKYLHGNIFQESVNLYSIDFSGTHVDYLDSLAIEILSNNLDLRFNDFRLCCIFKRNNHCLQIRTHFPCTTLLPNRLVSCIILPCGAMLVVLNAFAFYASSKLSKALLYSKITTLLLFVDAVLASYLPALGSADLYYDSYFIITMKQWQQGLPCQLMNIVSSTASVFSLLLSSLLVFLTSQAITQIGGSVFEKRHNIITAVVLISMTSVLYGFAISINDILPDNSVDGKAYLCNFIGDYTFNSKTGILLVIILCILMLASVTCIIISAINLVLHIRNTTIEMTRVSKVKFASSQERDGVCRFMITLVIIKMVVILPYPLLQVIRFVDHNVPEIASVYVMMMFIILESFSNPVIFVLRPLLVQKNKNMIRPQAT